MHDLNTSDADGVAKLMRLALLALALAGAAALPAAATPLAPSHEFAAEPSASLDPAVEAYIASRRSG